MTQQGIDAVIDEAPFRPIQLRAVALCMLVTLVDGVDAQSIAIVLPTMARDLGFGKIEMGLILSVMQIGAILGGFGFGLLADRIGRKPSIMFALLLVSLFTWASAFSQPLWTMLVVRTMAGIGLAGTLPPAVALASEFAAQRFRGTIVAVVGTGYALGAALGAFFSGYLVEAFGWKMVFQVGAALSLFVMALVLALLPESPRYLASRGRRPAALARILARIAPDVDIARVVLDRPASVSEARSPARGPLREIFDSSFLRTTLLITLCCVAAGVAVRVLTAWLPTILVEGGMDIRQSANVLGVLNLACVGGMALVGRLADRYGYKVAIVPAMLIAGGAALGFIFVSHVGAIFVIAGLIGFLMGGATSGPMIAAAALYPTRIRSTGMGYVTGTSRLGMTAGPMLVPVLLIAAPLGAVYVMVSLAFLITGLALWAISRSAGDESA